MEADSLGQRSHGSRQNYGTGTRLDVTQVFKHNDYFHVVNGHGHINKINKGTGRSH